MAYIGRDPQYGAFEKQALTADGSTTTFTLDYTVGSASSILVSVAGVHQEPETAYNLGTNGTQIVFTAAPAASDTVFVIFLGAALEVATIGSGVITARTELAERAATGDFFLMFDTSASSLKKIQTSNIVKASVTRNYTGDGSDSTFDVTSGTTVDNVLVFENGVCQKPTTDYTISGTTLTFQGGAPATGVAIQIRELPA
tara:strand:+ start:1085 stop:1684 length:600 start_codon:yes stop_codon:yes gene_type:complete